MPEKRKIKIELSEEDEALVYYERICGRNESIKRHARVLYYANQGTESLKELCVLAGCGKVAVNKVLKEYAEDGVQAIYHCARGKRVNHLDEIGDELEAYFDENPPADVPDAVEKIKEKWGITLTATPVRYWLKKRNIHTRNREASRQKPT